MNRWTSLLVACAVAAQALIFAWLIHDPDPYCFGYELGLGLVGGVMAPLVAAFVGGLALALVRARIVAYVLLAVCLAIAAGSGFVVGLAMGYDHCLPASPSDRGLSWAVIGLIASLVGLVPGFAIGWLVRTLGTLTRSHGDR